MDKLKIFLSGSFTENKKDFDLIEGLLTDAGKHGNIEIVRMDKYWESQTDHDTSNFEKIDYWLIDLDFMLDCTVVVFCKGWENHAGCRLEHKFAESMGMLIFDQDAIIKIDREKPVEAKEWNDEED